MKPNENTTIGFTESLSKPKLVPKEKKVMSEFEVLHELYREHRRGIIKNIAYHEEFMKKSNPTSIATNNWEKVIKLLHFRDLFALLRTCIFLKNLVDKEEVWHYLYHESFNDRNAVLQKHEKSWKFKLKYYSGFVEKSGMVEKLGGVLWNNWIPCWLVLSGPSLYAFTVPNMPKREKELTQLAHDGLYAVMRKEFQPAHEPLNMKLAKLFLGTKISSGGMQRFGLKVNNVEHVWRSSERETIVWISMLSHQLHSLQNDFGVRNV